MTPISLFVISHRSKAARDKNRDISEKIALGLPNAGNVSQEALYDQRLFNSTKVSYSLKSVLSSFWEVFHSKLLVFEILLVPCSPMISWKNGYNFVGKCNFKMLIVPCSKLMNSSATTSRQLFSQDAPFYWFDRVLSTPMSLNHSFPDSHRVLPLV